MRNPRRKHRREHRIENALNYGYTKQNLKDMERREQLLLRKRSPLGQSLQEQRKGPEEES